MPLADQTATTSFATTATPKAPMPTQTASQPQPCQRRRINLSPNERKVSVIAGGALGLLGLSRRSIPGVALAALGGAVLYRGASGHCPVYEALGIDSHGDDDSPREAPEPREYFQRSIHVERAITIDKPRAELFAFWRNFQNLPRFMQHLQHVDVIDARRSHWCTKGPAGSRVQWDAEIINEEPDALIAWRSLGGADVDSAGSVRFIESPRGRGGTQVRVVLDYIPPAGRHGR